MNPSAPGSADRHHLAARFVDGPHVAASDNAEQRLTDWLAELEPAQSAALDELLDCPFARPILLGLAEFSPSDESRRNANQRAPVIRPRRDRPLIEVARPLTLELDHPAHRIGQVVTVLYDPRRPQVCLV
jgi:hypothetical protein